MTGMNQSECMNYYVGSSYIWFNITNIKDIILLLFYHVFLNKFQMLHIFIIIVVITFNMKQAKTSTIGPTKKHIYQKVPLCKL